MAGGQECGAPSYRACREIASIGEGCLLLLSNSVDRQLKAKVSVRSLVTVTWGRSPHVCGIWYNYYSDAIIQVRMTERERDRRTMAVVFARGEEQLSYSTTKHDT